MKTTTQINRTPRFNTPPSGGAVIQEHSMQSFNWMFFELWGPRIKEKRSLIEIQDSLISEYLANKSLTSSML
jgi:hypothetical protein